MFIAFRLPASSRSRRKNLLSTERFFFFDLGVRHAAAEVPLDAAMVLGNPGPVFEQWVGIELRKRLQYLGAEVIRWSGWIADRWHVLNSCSAPGSHHAPGPGSPP